MNLLAIGAAALVLAGLAMLSQQPKTASGTVGKLPGRATRDGAPLKPAAGNEVATFGGG